MILRIKNPKIVIPQDADGNVIEDQKYLSVELVDPLNPSMKPVKKNIFHSTNPGFVEEWEENLPEDRGGLWEPEGTEDWALTLVPKSLRFLKNAQFEKYDLGGKHFMKYSRDLGNHKKGDIVRDRNGHVKVYTHVTVVTQVAYQMTPVLDEYGDIVLDANDNVKQKIVLDEEGRPVITGYLPGWELDRLGAQDASMYYPWDELEDALDEDLDEEEEDIEEDVEEEEEEEVVETRAPRRTRRG